METIQELQEMERQLQAQLHHKEEQEDRLQEYELQIASFHERERNMLTQVEELTESETNLKSCVSTLEATLKELKAEDSKERSYKDIQKIIELENRIQELTEKEAKLLEHSYQLKMEKQEMQDHIELLVSDVESSNPTSPRADNEKSRSVVIYI